MPELPEVETVLRTLEHQIKDQQIEDVDIFYEKMIEIDQDSFVSELKGQHFRKFERRGKYLLFILDEYTLIVHLRMEGKFYVYPKEYKGKDKHTHVIFYLSDKQLHYNDVRKFGRMWLYKKDEDYSCLEKLGYEPFDERLTGNYLKKFNKNNKTKIKTQLLDQSMITGIGNIYADEILFKAGINPLVEARFISENDCDKIISATREILKEAIRQGGTTIRSYTSSLGVTGLFQQYLMVHSRDDGTCYKCNSDIVRVKVNGRSTYYCPTCQKERPITLAITGSIGSGKSTVTKLLAEEGYKTISCDEINRELLQKEEVKEELSKILEEPFCKEALSKHIFTNSEQGKAAENYLHEMIFKEVSKFIETNNKEILLVIEVPLLFESKWDKYFDYNVAVFTPTDKLYERLEKDRHMSKDQIKERLDKQLLAEEKKQLADYCINNDADLEQLKVNTKKMIKNILG